MSTPVTRLTGLPRWAALAILPVSAPVFAEYSSGYLDSTGDPAAMAVELVFFIPLYGFMAVLIREISVRTGRGWAGTLLLAAAFGTLQAGMIDRSIFTLHGTGYDIWPDIMSPTWVPALGFAVGPAIGWVLGHVITSIGAPIAITHLLVGPAVGKRLIGIPGLVITSLGWLVMAYGVHNEISKTYLPVPSIAQSAAVVAVAAGLVALALSPVGRARTRTPMTGLPVRRLIPPALLGGALMFAVDWASSSWFATGVCVVAAIAAGVLLRHLSRTQWWHPVASPASVALGAMLVRAVEGFLTPAAGTVTMTAKLAHNSIFLLLVIGLWAVLLTRRRPRG